MAIKVLSWNIFRFAASLVGATDRINRVLDLVHPVVGGVGAPAFQVFVVIEPQNVSFLAPGEIAQGSGTLGIHQLLGKLQNRNGGGIWRVAPPLSLAQGGKEAETMGVFYDSSVLRLTGPQRSANVRPPWNTLPGDPGKLFWIDQTAQKVRRSELDGGSCADVTTNVVAESLRFDLRNKRVCWADTINDKISAAPVGGGGAADLVSGAGSPRHLAVDSYRSTLYWIDIANGDAMMRADLDGNNQKEVKTHKNKNSVTSTGLLAFEQNPRKENVEAYWLDSGEVSYLHGKLSDLRRTDYGSNKNIDARSLAVDFANERLYWIDDTSNKIRRGKLNGAAAKDLVTTDVPQDLRLEPAGGHLYWRDETTKSLRRLDIHAEPVTAQDVVRSG